MSSNKYLLIVVLWEGKICQMLQLFQAELAALEPLHLCFFSQSGYEVVSLYRNDEDSAQKFSDLHNIQSLKCDVSDYESCQRVVEGIKARSGAPCVLVNNAGITRDATFHKMNSDMWNDVVGTNLDGVFNLTHSVWPHTMSEKYGRIVNISSINGQNGQIGQANYSATKAAVLGMTRTLALEGARHNITVNAVAPGYIETDMVAALPQKTIDKIKAKIPAGRFGTPSDIARCVLFLVDKSAGFINGSTITVNGAQYLV